MNESIERMRKLVNDNLVMGLRFQMNRELNKLESEIEQELNAIAREPIVRCRDCTGLVETWDGWECERFSGEYHRAEPDGFCSWAERRDA